MTMGWRVLAAIVTVGISEAVQEIQQSNQERREAMYINALGSQAIVEHLIKQYFGAALKSHGIYLQVREQDVA
eukprot:TRINITY_DN3444_c0_g1_i1.p2 TRINITY_DN3444_c0_g1~~TRINITY_DN3444_c0_g1_i1.p2  ORF type:complete len:73 (-),score=15.02 TRINITY_DN3444_c0_g1_i1:214-432(-)